MFIVTENTGSVNIYKCTNIHASAPWLSSFIHLVFKYGGIYIRGQRVTA